MEQDEVYHSAMDAAGSKLKNGKAGLDKDGRPLVDAARRQRKAIQSEQVRCVRSSSVLLPHVVQDDTLAGRPFGLTLCRVSLKVSPEVFLVRADKVVE